MFCTRYQCTGNGQESGIVRKWVCSFIVFMLVAMFFMSPLKIVFSKVLLPNLVLNRMEQGGLRFEGERALMADSSEASDADAMDPAHAFETSAPSTGGNAKDKAGSRRVVKQVVRARNLKTLV